MDYHTGFVFDVCLVLDLATAFDIITKLSCGVDDYGLAAFLPTTITTVFFIYKSLEIAFSSDHL